MWRAVWMAAAAAMLTMSVGVAAADTVLPVLRTASAPRRVRFDAEGTGSWTGPAGPEKMGRDVLGLCSFAVPIIKRLWGR
jgi:hypothetical protein